MGDRLFFFLDRLNLSRNSLDSLDLFFFGGLDASFDDTELESSASSSLLEEDSDAAGSETFASTGIEAMSLAGAAGLLANSGKACMLKMGPVGFLASPVAPVVVCLGGAGFLSALLKVRGPLVPLGLVLGFGAVLASLGQSVETWVAHPTS